jgi:hypothetical protein
MLERRAALGGPVPRRVVRSKPLPVPSPNVDKEFDGGSTTAVSTTMVFTRLLRNLIREPELGRRVPARELLADLVAVCRPHAEALDCAAELDGVIPLGERTGAQRQIEQARSLGSLPRLVGLLASDFLARG